MKDFTISETTDTATMEPPVAPPVTPNRPNKNSKKISKLIRDEGPKGVKAQIQGDELRVSSKKRDDLQAAMALLRKEGRTFRVINAHLELPHPVQAAQVAEVFGLDGGATGTSIPGVFAAGDCTTVPYKQIIIAMGEGAKVLAARASH